VVIAIIGLLIGLLLPAVQAAREAASRMQCSNRIKQLALGLHNYHDTYQTFPCGAMNYGGNTSVRIGGLMALLPYVEQEPLYDAYLAKIIDLGPTVQHTFYSGNVDEIADHQIDTFVCPSDPGSKAPFLNSHIYRPNSYRFSFGDWPTQSHSSDGRQKTSNPRGLFSLRHNQSRAVSAVKDGTSNTIALSEGGIGYNDDAKNMDVKGNLRHNLKSMGEPTVDPGTTAVTSPSTTFDLNVCWVTNKGKKQYSASTDIARGNMGRSWGDSLPHKTGFMTIFPPNTGPNCMAGDAGVYDASIAVISASSYHPAGVQCGMTDGAVRFIPNKINCLSTGTPADYTNPSGTTSLIVGSGTSPFGIWGALGSIAGSESVAVP
jgi:hypothetical protein